MRFSIARIAVLTCLATLLASSPFHSMAADTSEEKKPLTLVVMDPLALPLSCPCVKGYAQRDYKKLAEHLEKSLGQPVKIAFNESLTAALKEETEGKVDLVIGKCSVVEFDAKKNQLTANQVAMLTDKEGVTTQTGLVVVPTDDPAKTAADLKGYRIIFGPKECDEKHDAVLALLKRNGVEAPAELETSPACSDGACLILEAGADVRGAAAISSYARPLLEGCGTVKKGALRVVGTTEPVPFIGAFVVGATPSGQQRIADALIESTQDPVLRVALETRSGFVAASSPPTRTAKKK